MSILYWSLYKTFLRFFTILLIWHPKVRERLVFETKNTTEELAKSFKQIGLQADLCFEFSSEGEFQQVASFIEDALRENKKLELVFFSPSVEKAVLDLAAKYPDQIRYLRFPLLRMEFLNWITANELILVRYDFFLEFLIWAKKPNNKLKLIWLSFKKSRLKDKDINWYKRRFLKLSSLNIFASNEDLQFAQALGFQGSVYDFRIDQIQRRIESRNEKFNKMFENYFSLKEVMDKYPRQKRLIVGNAWPSDLFLLEKLPSDIFLLIVPHKLDKNMLHLFEEGMSKLARKAVVSKGDETFPSVQYLILNKKGVLCELYADFGHAYVGGGFEGSIHSVLEPLVAGSELISCGPQHMRSTEYDVARSLGRITEVNSANEFNTWLASIEADSNVLQDLKEVFGSYNEYRKEIISC